MKLMKLFVVTDLGDPSKLIFPVSVNVIVLLDCAVTNNIVPSGIVVYPSSSILSTDAVVPLNVSTTITDPVAVTVAFVTADADTKFLPKIQNPRPLNAVSPLLISTLRVVFMEDALIVTKLFNDLRSFI